MSKLRWLGAMFALILGISPAWAQIDPSAEEVGIEEYCGNMGIIKSIAEGRIILEGMNWDFESDSETVQETYDITDASKVELDGYVRLEDVKEGDFVGIGCEKRDDKLIAVFIQSEEAINRSFEETADAYDDMEEIVTDVAETVEAAAPDAAAVPQTAVETVPAVEEQPAAAPAEVVPAQ